MTNTAKLKGALVEKGFRQCDIAEKIGLSKTAFFNKLHNKREFTASEIMSLVKILNIEDKDAIFFAEIVE